MFLSSAGEDMNIVMAINMGGDDFVAKPFDMQLLLAKNTGSAETLLRFQCADQNRSIRT